MYLQLDGVQCKGGNVCGDGSGVKVITYLCADKVFEFLSVNLIYVTTNITTLL